MLNCSTSLAMSTCVLKALPGKLDIKRHSPSILYIQLCKCLGAKMLFILMNHKMTVNLFSPSSFIDHNWATTCDFQQCGILTCETGLCRLLLSLQTPNYVQSVAYTRRIFKRLVKALSKLPVCTGWSEALLDAHTTLLEILCCGSYSLKKSK